MSHATARLPLVDFHSHYVDPSWNLTTDKVGDATQRQRWAKINRQLTDADALLGAVRSGDLDARVINTPTAFLQDADGNVAADSYARINDQLAELIQRHPGQLHALATVDSFGGDAAAVELERAVRTLGLRGVFLESARGELLLDAPQARPVLATAARLGVPVFVHPVNPEPLSTQLAPYGRLGTLLARGTVNSAALVALLESGTFDELPDLNVVVTALAIGGILLSSTFGADSTSHDGLRSDAATLLRRQVYVDSMGFNPALLRAAIDTLGADHILAGSDWPIVNQDAIQGVAASTFTAAGLDTALSHQVASGNALRLLGLAA